MIVAERADRRSEKYCLIAVEAGAAGQYSPHFSRSCHFYEAHGASRTDLGRQW
jgi:hypothetical protein